LTAWTLGPWYYNTGYSVYTNPYYAAPSSTVVVQGPAIDYSRPIDASSQTPENVSDGAMQQFDAAQAAFRSGDYSRALRGVEQALEQMPNDSVLHEFRALALFALTRYNDAAAALYAVLSVGPGWDWTTMSSLYPSVDVYTAQLRSLEHYADDHPESAEAHFVLAYHYMTAGHAEAAAEQLNDVVRLKPTDSLSVQLLRLVSPEGTPSPAAGPSQPAQEATTQAATETFNLVGGWVAQPAAGSKIELSLTDEGAYTWRFTGGGKTNEIDGTYESAGDVLVLQQAGGGAMVGNVAWENERAFTFKLIGGPPNDPGLRFRRE
jgi:tetratricopeptide (TPR) repeat protein